MVSGASTRENLVDTAIIAKDRIRQPVDGGVGKECCQPS